MKALILLLLSISFAPAQTRLGVRKLNRVDGGPPPPVKNTFVGIVMELRTNINSIAFFVNNAWRWPGSRTQIMKDGSPARMEQVKVGDWVGGVQDVKSGLLENATFTTRAPEKQMTKEEAQKHREAMEAKTLKYHQQLADRGDAYGQLQMGLRYRDGRGVTNDLKQCRSLLALSAGQGNTEAKAALAKLDRPSP